MTDEITVFLSATPIESPVGTLGQVSSAADGAFLAARDPFRLARLEQREKDRLAWRDAQLKKHRGRR